MTWRPPARPDCPPAEANAFAPKATTPTVARRIANLKFVRALIYSFPDRTASTTRSGSRPARWATSATTLTIAWVNAGKIGSACQSLPQEGDGDGVAGAIRMESRIAWTSTLVASSSTPGFSGATIDEPLPVDVKDPYPVDLAWSHAKPGTQRQFPGEELPVR